MFFGYPITFYIVNNNLSSKLEMDGKNMGEIDKNTAPDFRGGMQIILF